ncbi:MAG: radical SAM protein [Candidatus Omnitrophota bacterium]|nr:MAG: radical SAM protein [Candidatus Omnitrophota bacterium]
MNFILATIPIRSQPSDVPPVGAISLLETLIQAGYDSKFYDIDALRPSFEQVVDYFRREQPDILGISAVVSTAYRYAKKLAYAVKEVSPGTRIILGGCLAASAEVLLRKCPIDLCVVGEGEKVLANLLKHWEKFGDFNASQEELRKIKGIAFIDSEGDFIFTGYEEQLLPEELPQPNYELLSKFSNLDCYIRDGLSSGYFEHDKRSYQPHRRGQKACWVLAGKGCASRCTFCHRWIKGYRAYPVKTVIDTMRKLKEKYNVGFFSLGDESFGSDRRVLEEFIEAVRPLDILFQIAGIRVTTVYRNPEVIRRLKEVGCVRTIFGMESGSDKILRVMEKAVNRKQNLEVAKILLKEGMYTIHQFVVGMPGENEETIKETIECAKLATETSSSYPIISNNYFQALPGTPGYEYLRFRGLIGKTLDDEEAYLLEISNMDAGSRAHYKNVSEEPLSKVFLWPHRIRVEVTTHWYKQHNWKPANINGNSAGMRHWLTTRRFYFRAVSLLGSFYWSLALILMRIRLYGLARAFSFTLGFKEEDDRNSFIIKEPKSLRRIVNYPQPEEMSISEANMLPLRKGR